MDWKYLYPIVVANLLLSANPILGQQTETLKFPNSGDSCNVVNVNCAAGVPEQPNEHAKRIPGPPGKIGPVGPVGPVGLKGARGLRGENGKEINVTEITENVLGLLRKEIVDQFNSSNIQVQIQINETKDRLSDSERKNAKLEGIINKLNSSLMDVKMRSEGVSSCSELQSQFGITKSGHYLMRIRNSSQPTYAYCDFTIRGDVTTCEELKTKFNLTISGYYRVREENSEQLIYVKCDFRVSQGIHNALTCQQLWEAGITHSGNYAAYDEQEGSFTLSCEFTPEKAITVVEHDMMNEVEVGNRICMPAGCYSRSPQYSMTDDQILKIIENSRECRQYIKARCRGTYFLHQGDGYAWWVSRKGEKMRYWGGATSRRDKYCACGETGTCVDNRYKCNCDINDHNRVTQDEGYLTDKTKLPVRELRFGDMDDPGETTWHTLGKLECWGQA